VKRKFFWLAIFAIAMGILEAITVVYLRELNFAGLQPIEIVREASTIIMILTVAMITSQSTIRRVSCFFYIFGIWDVFYYVGLKLFIDWPPSLLTWDHLFYIPILWQGPVLVPIIISILLIALGIKMVYLKTQIWEWLLLTVGLAIIIFSFWVPTINNSLTYPWFLFSAGLGIMGTAEIPILLNSVSKKWGLH
jgi:hypothetical protein